jgi:O-Antigen ligase
MWEGRHDTLGRPTAQILPLPVRTASLRAGPLVGTTIAAGAVIALATLVRTDAEMAVGIAALCAAAAFALLAPSLLFVAAFAGVYAYWRVGPATLNMSVCDAVTVLAIVAAIPFAPWNSVALRRVLSALFFYLGLVLITVAAHPSGRSLAEWFHRGVLVGGAVIIGAAVAHRGQIAMALRAFLAVGVVVAVAAVVEMLSSGLTSAYPLGMHKNAAGPLLGIAAIVLVAAPKKTGLSHGVVRYMRLLMLAGLFATQSRGAAIALVGVVAIYAMRHGRRRLRAPMFLLALAVVLLAVSLATLESETIENPDYNAVVLRVESFDIAINDVWASNPLAGGGLRWFISSGNVPHNLVIAELSEAGVLGLFGLIVLILTLFRALARRRDPIGEAAYLGLVFLILFGLTGIFWVAGTMTLPMLLVGLAVGADETVHKRAVTGATVVDPSP